MNSTKPQSSGSSSTSSRIAAAACLATIFSVGTLPCVACGGAPATETKAPSNGGAAAAGGPTDTPATPDAGPTTTTTLTLGDGGGLQGTKLSSSSQTTVGTDVDGGAHGPHQQDPGRSAKDIQAIIVSHRDEARACYDTALKAHPGIEGDLDIQWTIDPKGLVSDLSVDASRSQITEPSVQNCIFSVIKQIHFNESARGFETRAHYPFNFHPRSRGSLVGADAGTR